MFDDDVGSRLQMFWPDHGVYYRAFTAMYYPHATGVYPGGISRELVNFDTTSRPWTFIDIIEQPESSPFYFIGKIGFINLEESDKGVKKSKKFVVVLDALPFAFLGNPLGNFDEGAKYFFAFAVISETFASIDINEVNFTILNQHMSQNLAS